MSDNKNSFSIRIESLFSIIANIFILIFVNIYYTDIPFTTSDFLYWIPVFNILIGINIIGYFILFLVNKDRFKFFLEFITGSIGIWAFYNLYKIFPFVFSNTSYSKAFHIIIIFIIVGCLISALVNFIKLIISK